MRYCTATARARNSACRHCAQPPTSARATNRMIAMSGRNLDSPLMGSSLRALRLGQVADGLVVAVAVSLPWSTSATAILIVLWLLAFVPTIDAAALRRELLSPAVRLPVLRAGAGALGMLWADVSWSERTAETGGGEGEGGEVQRA